VRLPYDDAERRKDDKNQCTESCRVKFTSCGGTRDILRYPGGFFCPHLDGHFFKCSFFPDSRAVCFASYA
jgi:hypothetical protein